MNKSTLLSYIQPGMEIKVTYNDSQTSKLYRLKFIVLSCDNLKGVIQYVLPPTTAKKLASRRLLHFEISIPKGIVVFSSYCEKVLKRGDRYIGISFIPNNLQLKSFAQYERVPSFIRVNIFLQYTSGSHSFYDIKRTPENYIRGTLKNISMGGALLEHKTPIDLNKIIILDFAQTREEQMGTIEAFLVNTSQADTNYRSGIKLIVENNQSVAKSITSLAVKKRQLYNSITSKKGL